MRQFDLVLHKMSFGREPTRSHLRNMAFHCPTVTSQRQLQAEYVTIVPQIFLLWDLLSLR